MVFAVTGGTGFLGSALTRALEQRGHQVQIISRSHGYDITREETLQGAFEDAEIVFHLAALVQSRPGAFEETNKTGLENVFRRCLQEGPKRLIYVSSFTVFGPSGNAVHSEATIPERNSFFHAYDQSKFEALAIARKWRSRIPMNIIFPTVVFGPGPLTEGNIMVRLFARWLKFRVASLPGKGSPVWNFVYIEDVVNGLIAVAENQSDNDYILGGSNISLWDLAETLAEVSSTKLHLFGMPDWLFRLSCHGEDLASRLFGFTPLVLPDTGAFLLNNWRFSSSKAESELGYEHQGLEQALEYTYQWMRKAQII